MRLSATIIRIPMLKITDFDYDLPKELIAQYPLPKRDAARMQIINRRGCAVEDSFFTKLSDYLREGDLLVLNDTRVLAARLLGRRATGGRVEVLILGRKNGMTFRALLKPGRVKLGEKIIFNGQTLYGELTGKNEITFSTEDPEEIYRHGVMPLPPYIKRPSRDEDKTDYQTVYARQDGSIASPTAGLHFTEGLLSEIRSRKVNIACVTLHIGYSTFRPVKAEDVTLHKMEPEYFNIPQETAQTIEDTRSRGGRVIAVGTTAMRALETFAEGRREGQTDLFIYPGYTFKITDCLLTNFHLPRTTLFMLVCAFAGEDLAKRAYREAVVKEYRFYSYGDAMLIV